MESIRNSMDPKTKKNMKIPRKKEKPEQPVITSIITRLPSLI
jgi:hypothetical protein